MNASTSVVVVEPSSDRPILFVGPPRAVVADITLMNPGERSLVVRDFGVTDHSGRLAHLPARHGLMPAVLRGGQQRQLRIGLALPAPTPPGTYRVALDIMGEARNAVLHVTEEVALRLEPDTLWVANAPHGQRKRLTLINTGNVPAPLSDICDVPLRDDLAPAVDMRQALQGLAAKSNLQADELVDVLIAPLRRSNVIVGSLSLGIVGEAVTIAPGEMRSLEVEIKLAEPPPPNGRARARVPLMDATLDVVVLPSGPAQAPPRNPREQRDDTESRIRSNKPGSASAPRKK